MHDLNDAQVCLNVNKVMFAITFAGRALIFGMCVPCLKFIYYML